MYQWAFFLRRPKLRCTREGSTAPKLRSSEAPKLRSSEAPKLQGSTAPILQGAEAPRFQGSTVLGCFGSLALRFRSVVAPGSLGTLALWFRGSEGLKLRGSVSDADAMRSIAFISEKGGTGKTTSVLNVAGELARLGQRVLVVDADPQGNASLVLLNGEKPESPTLSHVLGGLSGVREAIRPTRFERLSLLAGGALLADVALQLAGELGRERRLRLALQEISDQFDFILADSPPTRSILTINVLNACGEVVVPVDPGLFSLAGLGQLQAVMDDVRRYLDNSSLRLLGIVLTRMVRNNVAAGVEQQLRAMYPEAVFSSVIPNNVRAEEAHSRGEPVTTYAPKSPAATAYIKLVKEILNRGNSDIEKNGTRRDSLESPATERAA